MTLQNPFIITARLLPGLHIGNAFVSIEYAGSTSDGRQRYRYHIDIGDKTHTADDLSSGVGGGSLQDGMESLLSILSACAESRAYRRYAKRAGENENLFPEFIADWADTYSDEISMLQCEIEEAENLIEE